jgi:CBS domain containing-hemolysin-like protein
LNNNGNWFVRRFGIEPKEELSAARTAEELASLVRRSAMLGSLESDTAKLLEKTLGMSTLTASDIMTPRPKMHSLEREQSSADLGQPRSRIGATPDFRSSARMPTTLLVSRT